VELITAQYLKLARYERLPFLLLKKGKKEKKKAEPGKTHFK